LCGKTPSQGFHSDLCVAERQAKGKNANTTQGEERQNKGCDN